MQRQERAEVGVLRAFAPGRALASLLARHFDVLIDERMLERAARIAQPLQDLRRLDALVASDDQAAGMRPTS